MKKNVTMMQIRQNPRYRGKHIVIAEGRLYTAKTGEGAVEIVQRLWKKNPKIVPEVSYMPKAKIITV